MLPPRWLASLVYVALPAPSQLGYEVFDDKLNLLQVDELVIGLIAFNLVAALLPASGTFVPDEEVRLAQPALRA
jgi:photosystem II protein